MANELENVTLRNPTLVGSLSGIIAETNLPQRDLENFLMPAQDARVHDAVTSFLPTTPAADDLGLIEGTFGTDGVTIQTGDLKAAGATTRYCRWPQVIVPSWHVAGQTVVVRLYCGMLTTVSDGTATIDVEAYLSDGEGGVGSDICTTAAQTINSLTHANREFDLGTRSPGDIIDIRVAIAISDAATGTAVIGNLGRAYLAADIR